MDITLEGLVAGLLAVAVGLALAFYGLRVFLVLLPIWGFVAGFLVGASATSYLLGGADPGFLATTAAWVVGIVVGLVFAVLSYLYWYGAVILLGGALGYQVTLGVIAWLGLNVDGVVAFVLALIVGALFAVAFVILQMPVVLVIVATAISGAGATVAGVLIALGLVPEGSRQEAFQAGIFGVYTLNDLSIIWLIAGVALAIAGAWYQMRNAADMAARITQDQYRNPGMTGPTGAPAA